MRQCNGATVLGMSSKSSAARTADANPRMPQAECPWLARSAIQRDRTSPKDHVGMEVSNSANWWMADPYLCRVSGFYECIVATLG